MTRFHDSRGPMHLRDGFCVDRSGDDIVLLFRKDGDTLGAAELPVNEWASAVAFTTSEGENDSTYRAALELLGTVESAPVSDEVIAAIERCPEWRTRGVVTSGSGGAASGAERAFIDARCGCQACEERTGNVYRMVGYCSNCGQTDILCLYRSGDSVRDLDCPRCGHYYSVRQLSQRLATDDEIPALALLGGQP